MEGQRYEHVQHTEEQRGDQCHPDRCEKADVGERTAKCTRLADVSRGAGERSGDDGDHAGKNADDDKHCADGCELGNRTDSRADDEAEDGEAERCPEDLTAPFAWCAEG